MSGPPPNQQRRRRNAPVSGDWQPSPGVGWQYGEIPDPPDGLLPASVEAWQTWFRAWFAAHWRPHDVWTLYIVIHLFDRVARGAPPSHARELAHWLDNFGITPKGQQARRWLPPSGDEVRGPTAGNPLSRFAHLRVVDDEPSVKRRPSSPKEVPPDA